MSAKVYIVLLILFSACAGTKHPSIESGSNCSDRMVQRMYFGFNKPNGVVSESEWRFFVKDVITPAFPAGLTVIEARGQWLGQDSKIAEEPSRIVEIVYDDSQDLSGAVQAISAAYKSRFQQEAVMILKNKVNACFE